jgi:hypothetical protein
MSPPSIVLDEPQLQDRANFTLILLCFPLPPLAVDSANTVVWMACRPFLFRSSSFRHDHRLLFRSSVLNDPRDCRVSTAL